MFIVFGTIRDTCKPLAWGLLPDKSSRSYDEFFSQLNGALKRNQLKLAATSFMSDFEPAIPKYFCQWFPGIPAQGCYFHFGKSIWKMVSANGMKRFYSSKSEEPSFGNFVRLILGLPFLKVDDLHIGLRNIEKASANFKLDSCKAFAKKMLRYLNSFWMTKDHSTWNVYNVKTRTNNRAGISFKINILMLSGHRAI